MTNTASIVEAFFHAMHGQDLPGARALLADDLLFEGPIDTFNNPDDYLASLAKLAPIVDRVEVQAMFFGDSDACVVYDLVTKTPIRTSHVAEWFRTDGDKITGIRVHFDARPFAAMFEKSA